MFSGASHIYMQSGRILPDAMDDGTNKIYEAKCISLQASLLCMLASHHLLALCFQTISMSNRLYSDYVHKSQTQDS